jgi:hypothetical protein
LIASTFLLASALAGCMPTEETASLTSTPSAAQISPVALASDAPTAQQVAVTTFRAPAYAPLPPARPDFEGVTPASRALGAIVADAEAVERKLEEDADAAPPKPAPAAAPLVASTAGLPKPATNSPGYYAAYEDTIVTCFPQQLRDALNVIADHYGQPVEVTSGMRARGRSHSLHRSCSAADIRVAGVGPSTLATFAKGVDGINGVGTYRYNDVTHVDVRQDKMAWRY